MITDLDIYRSANLWLAQHGEEAIPKARELAVGFQVKGDLDGSDTWVRIIVAIETMRLPRSTDLA